MAERSSARRRSVAARRSTRTPGGRTGRTLRGGRPGMPVGLAHRQFRVASDGRRPCGLAGAAVQSWGISILESGKVMRLLVRWRWLTSKARANERTRRTRRAIVLFASDNHLSACAARSHERAKRAASRIRCALSRAHDHAERCLRGSLAARRSYLRPSRNSARRLLVKTTVPQTSSGDGWSSSM